MEGKELLCGSSKEAEWLFLGWGAFFQKDQCLRVHDLAETACQGEGGIFVLFCFFGPQRSQSLFFLVLTLQRFFPNFHVEACIFLKILVKAFKAIDAFCTVASKHRRQKNRNSLKLLLTFRSGLVMETGSRNQTGCHRPGDTMLTNIGRNYISLQAESLLETRDLNQNDGNLTCIANVKSRLIQSTHEKKKV